MTYLDHAATTPILPEALEAYLAASGAVGNASSLHAAGRHARRRVEEAREQVAAALRARPSEVIFTAGGTESDNLAVKGVFWARRAADPARIRVVAGSVEHHAVLDAVGWLEERGLTPLRACVGCPLSYAEIDRAIVGVDSLEHLQAVVADAAQPLVAPPVSLTSEETALLNPSRWNVT